jgi:TRAP transporter 4TM/12TM fusion protein
MIALLVRGLSLALCVFTVAEVNYPRLTPQAQLAIFMMLGLVIAFLTVPARKAWRGANPAFALDVCLALATVAVSAYVVVQTEPAFEAWWLTGQSLGNRAGFAIATDTAVGLMGLVLVLEGTRRTIGAALPILSLLFLAYASWGSLLPDWLFPHRGYGVDRIVGQTFLQAQGVFGVALSVMFTYVFLFVVLGALLELTGATEFIIGAATRAFRRTAGGPAKVGVISAGFMGTLSGSAVANTAACGAFTIPLMRSAGFRPETAAGVQAAASSGGALMPPVMGAAAYMMLEIVDPPVTYLEIIRAALIPAVLYYLTLFLYVHFYAKRAALGAGELPAADPATARAVGESRLVEGVIFFGALGVLMVLLALGYSPFRAVTVSMAAIVALSFLSARTRVTWTGLVSALAKSARDGVPLVSASASVGIVIGIVTLTGVGSRFPAALLPLAEESLFLALVIIMVSSIVLGMEACCSALVIGSGQADSVWNRSAARGKKPAARESPSRPAGTDCIEVKRRVSLKKAHGLCGHPFVFCVGATCVGGDVDARVAGFHEIVGEHVVLDLLAADVRKHDAVDLDTRREGLCGLANHLLVIRAVVDDVDGSAARWLSTCSSSFSTLALSFCISLSSCFLFLSRFL